MRDFSLRIKIVAKINFTYLERKNLRVKYLFSVKSGLTLACICCSIISFAIDLEPIDISEDTQVNCVQPCNRFAIQYDAYNLTQDKVDDANNDIIDNVLIVVRDGACQLVGVHLGEFRQGSHSMGFVSTIGGNIADVKSLPLTAYFIDVEGVEDLPPDGNFDDLDPFLSRELLYTGQFNFQELERVFPPPNCYPHKAKIYTYGDRNVLETGKDLIQTTDGGFLLVGFVNDGENTDVIVKKIDAQKEETWSKTYGGPFKEGHDTEINLVGDIEIVQDVDETYIISTTTLDTLIGQNTTGVSLNTSPYVFKINELGDIIWETRLQSDAASIFHDVIPNPNGGCFISFSSGSMTHNILEDSIHAVSMFGLIDIAVASIDQNGIVEWVHTVGDEFRNLQSSIDLSSDSTLIVLYESESELGSRIASLDTSGTVLWDRSFGKDQTDGVTEIHALPDGSYLAATYTFGEFDLDLRLIRLNEESLIWDKQYYTPFTDYIFSIFPGENGDIVLVGESLEAILFMTIDSEGNLISKQREILENEARFGGIIEIMDGYALVGSMINDLMIEGNEIVGGQEDMFLTFLDSNLEFSESQSAGLIGFIRNTASIAVPNVEVRLSSGELTMTDSNGRFEFDQITDFTNLTLNFSKDDDTLQEGLSSVDLVQILNHIIGILPFSNQIQIASADLNNDATVSSVDLIILRNVILGFATELPNNTPLWRFSQNHIPIQAIPDAPLQITANKVGDVNGDAIK